MEKLLSNSWRDFVFSSQTWGIEETIIITTIKTTQKYHFKANDISELEIGGGNSIMRLVGKDLLSSKKVWKSDCILVGICLYFKYFLISVFFNFVISFSIFSCIFCILLLSIYGCIFYLFELLD